MNCPLNAFQRLLLSYFAFGLGTVTGRANGTPITQDEESNKLRGQSIFFHGRRDLTWSFARVVRRSSVHGFIDARAPPHVHDPHA